MDNTIKIVCSCGETFEPDLSEEFNQKDIVTCDCGRKFLIVEISEQKNYMVFKMERWQR